MDLVRSDYDITPRQLRAARAGLNLSSDDLRALIGLARPTLKNYEADRPDGVPMIGRIETYGPLVGLYRDRGVIFGADEALQFTKPNPPTSGR